MRMLKYTKCAECAKGNVCKFRIQFEDAVKGTTNFCSNANKKENDVGDSVTLGMTCNYFLSEEQVLSHDKYYTKPMPETHLDHFTKVVKGVKGEKI